MKFNPQATGFDFNNARYLAEACKLAYLGDAKVIAAGLSLPPDDVKPFVVQRWDFNTEGFVARAPGAVILAFRGTSSIQDWATDLHATPANFDWIFQGAPHVGQIHAGFGHALVDSVPEILKVLVPCLQPREKEKTSPRLFITGHSLGGALAVLAAAACKLVSGWLYPVAGLYTYGQPRVATHAAANTFEREFSNVHFRFVNYEDLVPRVPPRSFDYTHTGQVIHFLPPKGYPLSEGPEQASWFTGAFADLQMLRGAITDGRREVEYHLLESKTGYLNTMDAYIEAIKAGKAKLLKM
jgi:triacylglycerol lipase